MRESNSHALRPAPDEDLATEIAARGPWFHNLRLHGHQTAPDHFLGDYPSVFFERFAHVMPARLDGWRVLEQDYAFHERWPFHDSGFPRLHFIEHRYAHDESNWWIPNHAAAEAMLRSAGFEILANPDREVFLCRPSSLPLRSLPRVFDRHARASA